jgi:hypothetical protein
MAKDPDSFEEVYAMAKLPPRLTGLPTAVWIAPNEDFPHDARVKVHRIHGGRGRWLDAAAVAVRPQPCETVPGSLMTADLAAVSRWIDLNQAVIVDYWDARLTSTRSCSAWPACHDTTIPSRGGKGLYRAKRLKNGQRLGEA